MHCVLEKARENLLSQLTEDRLEKVKAFLESSPSDNTLAERISLVYRKAKMHGIDLFLTDQERNGFDLSCMRDYGKEWIPDLDDKMDRDPMKAFVPLSVIFPRMSKEDSDGIRLINKPLRFSGGIFVLPSKKFYESATICGWINQAQICLVLGYDTKFEVRMIIRGLTTDKMKATAGAGVRIQYVGTGGLMFHSVHWNNRGGLLFDVVFFDFNRYPGEIKNGQRFNRSIDKLKASRNDGVWRSDYDETERRKLLDHITVNIQAADWLDLLSGTPRQPQAGNVVNHRRALNG